MLKVVKFGGSSLASAEQFQKVGAIVRAEEGRRYVVPSAPGKRYANDTKVMYYIEYGGSSRMITPLYNADGTLQIYQGE